MISFSRVCRYQLSENSVVFIKYTGSLEECGTNLFGDPEYIAEVDSIDGLSIHGRTVSTHGLDEGFHNLLVEAAYMDADKHVSDILLDHAERLERIV